MTTLDYSTQTSRQLQILLKRRGHSDSGVQTFHLWQFDLSLYSFTLHFVETRGQIPKQRQHFKPIFTHHKFS